MCIIMHLRDTVPKEKRKKGLGEGRGLERQRERGIEEGSVA